MRMRVVRWVKMIYLFVYLCLFEETGGGEGNGYVLEVYTVSLENKCSWPLAMGGGEKVKCTLWFAMAWLTEVAQQCRLPLSPRLPQSSFVVSPGSGVGVMYDSSPVAPVQCIFRCSHFLQLWRKSSSPSHSQSSAVHRNVLCSAAPPRTPV